MILDLFAAGSIPGVHVSEHDTERGFLWGYQPTHSRVPVTEDNVITSGTIYSGIRLLSEASSGLPLKVYRRRPDGAGADERRDHPIARLLQVEASADDDLAAHRWREQIVAQAVVWSHHVAEIVPDGMGSVGAIATLHPDRVQVVRDDSGAVVYEVRVERSSTSRESDQQPRRLRPRQVFHVPGFGVGGLSGLGLVAVARQAIGIALAAEKFGGLFFGNYARPIGFLKVAGALGRERTERIAEIRSTFEQMHSDGNIHRVGVLEGMEWQSLGVPPEEAQYLQTRQFQVIEAARFLRCPPHLLYDLQRANYNSMEQMSQEFLQFSLASWLTRIESEIHRKLLGGDSDWYARHNADALLRGTTLQRHTAHASALDRGWKNIDEVRALENLNPLLDGAGQQYRVPLNTAPVSGDDAGAADRDRPAPDDVEPRDPARLDQDQVDAAAADAWQRACALRLEQQTVALRRIAARTLPQGCGELLAAAADYHRQQRAVLRRELAAVAEPMSRLSPRMRVDLDQVVEEWIGFNERRLAASLDSAEPARDLEEELGTWHLRAGEMLDLLPRS